MFENKSIFEILSMGGATLYVLLFASIISVTVIIFKILEFKSKNKISVQNFMKKIHKLLQENNNITEVILFCKRINSPVANIVKAGLTQFLHTGKPNVKEAMKREILLETVKLERYTTIIGTIGSVSVYIGLFGTVIGIIHSFHNISLAGSGGISVVIGGVAESLIATATGLLVAIPAVVAYNFLSKAIDNFTVDMEYAVSATDDIIKLLPKESVYK
ncbi:MotA/TolQ/ExbB proton channel family protein [Candidatus Ruminimicrobium bovinum]|uniref:MotA/TolQ/ExbB proton channel family protein n=1 Tax=Candidatus Ruminimicrobium bovinum TaxID=3242779 RepID=UPI0039B933C7